MSMLLNKNKLIKIRSNPMKKRKKVEYNVAVESEQQKTK